MVNTMNKNTNYEFLYNDWDFKLDDFQKTAIQKIYNNENILVTVPTGSGKTLVAEYAIKQSFKKNKKCIYTAPIKALSNQKYAEFKRKFKNMSVGILTGDIKCNPDADILIMTTEILRNIIYNKNNKHNKIDLELDINNDIDCVVFDEVHYLNDKDRGKVWEETLILLPKHVNIVMLSATIRNPKDICEWMENIKGKKCNHINKERRIIPLTHSIYYNIPYSKSNKEYNENVKKYGNKIVNIMNNNNHFNDNNYHGVVKLKNMSIKIKNNPYHEKHIIKTLIHALNNKKMLPVLFFCFSRKKCQNFASNIDICLNNPQEQIEVGRIIDNSIHKLLNPEIYLNTPEYLLLKNILCKGIGFHHSGLISIFKEIVELLFERGLVKVLFCTETFAIGLNCPVKTVVLTDIKKYTNEGLRYLLSSEYSQIAGRAGRRGIDKFGNIILMGNSMELPEINRLKCIMANGPERITSKFTFDYNFILKSLYNQDFKFDLFIQNTFLNKDNISRKYELLNDYEYVNKEIHELNISQEEIIEFDKYYNIQMKINDGIKLTKGEKKLKTKYKKIPDNYKKYSDNYHLYNQLYYINNELNITENNMLNVINGKMTLLKSMNYITGNNKLKIKGIIASQICEIDEILITELIINNFFNKMTPQEICGIMGSFLNTKCLNEDNIAINEDYLDIPDNMKQKICELREYIDKINDNENNYHIIVDREINYSMIEYCYKWASGYSYNDLYFDNYRGVFNKDILRIDSIIQTLEVIYLNMDNKTLYNKLTSIHDMILRDGVMFESLYIKE